MMIHPESLHRLERQTHAEIMRQSERHRIALAASAQKPGWLSFRRYPRTAALARRWYVVVGSLAGRRRLPVGTPTANLEPSTTTVTLSTVTGPQLDSSLARSR